MESEPITPRQVVAYFNASGNAGPFATEVEWAAFGEWAETLDPAQYQQVLHLWENGWEDELDALAEQLRQGLDADDGRAGEDALTAAGQLFDTLDDRAEEDTAIAIRMDD